MSAKFKINKDGTGYTGYTTGSNAASEYKYSNTIMNLVFESVYSKIEEPPFIPLYGIWWWLDRIWYYSPIVLIFVLFCILFAQGLKLCKSKTKIRKVVKTQ